MLPNKSQRRFHAPRSIPIGCRDVKINLAHSDAISVRLIEDGHSPCRYLGYYSRRDGIVVADDAEDTLQLQSLLHEIGHAVADEYNVTLSHPVIAAVFERFLPAVVALPRYKRLRTLIRNLYS